MKESKFRCENRSDARHFADCMSLQNDLDILDEQAEDEAREVGNPVYRIQVSNDGCQSWQDVYESADTSQLVREVNKIDFESPRPVDPAFKSIIDKMAGER